MNILHGVPRGRHFLASFSVVIDEGAKLLSQLCRRPQIQYGEISGSLELSNPRVFTVCNSSYASYAGCSGGAVIVEDGEGLSLWGIHTELLWQSASDSPLAFEILSDEDEAEERTSSLSRIDNSPASSAPPAADSTPPSKVSEGSTPLQLFQLNSTDSKVEFLLHEVQTLKLNLKEAEGKKSSQPRFVVLSSVMGNNSGWDEKEILKIVKEKEVSPVDAGQSTLNDVEIVVPKRHSKRQKQQSSRAKSKSKRKQQFQKYLQMSAISENPEE